MNVHKHRGSALLFLAVLLATAASAGALEENEYIASEYDYVLTLKMHDGRITLTNITIDLHAAWPAVAGTAQVALADGANVLAKRSVRTSTVVFAEDARGGIPIIINSTTFQIRMPYDVRADIVVVTDAAGDSRHAIRDFTCHADNICSRGENAITCPADCGEGKNGICVPLIDGICDYDCTTESAEDLDCTREAEQENSSQAVVPIPPPTQNPVERKDGSWRGWVAAIGLLLIFALLVALHFYKRSKGPDEKSI